MKKLIILSAFFLLGVSSVFATAQIPDKIIIEGKEYKLHSNPLEEFFEKYPEKRPRGGIGSTALWRGYVATFEVKNDELYLKDIAVQERDKEAKDSFKTIWRSVKSEVFPEKDEVKIDWITGILVIPYGKIKNYVHMGYGSSYSKYILLEIEKGSVNEVRKLKYKQYEVFKQKQFEAFKQTEEYKNMVKELKEKEDHNDQFIESFLKSYVISYTSKFLD